MMTSGIGFSIRKYGPPLVPYITVTIGLLVFHNAWAAIFSYHACVVIVVSLLRTSAPSVNIIVHCKKAGAAITGIIIGASSGILLFVLWPLLSIPDDINAYLALIGLTNVTWPLFLAYFILVNPLIEEYYWRGLLGSVSNKPAANDFMFSGYHVIVLAGWVDILWLFIMFAFITAGAWIWRQLNRTASGLLPSLLSHFAADITIMTAIYFLTR